MQQTIEFELTHADLVEIYRDKIKASSRIRKPFLWIFYGVFGIPLLFVWVSVIFGNKLTFGQYVFMTCYSVVLIALPVCWRKLPLINAKLRVRNIAGTKLDPTGPMKIVINAQKMEYEISSTGGWANWDMISSTKMLAVHFLITIAKGSYIIIPIRAFDNREEFDQFILQINEYRNAKPSFEQVCPKCKYDLSGSESVGCPECGWRREE